MTKKIIGKDNAISFAEDNCDAFIVTRVREHKYWNDMSRSSALAVKNYCDVVDLYVFTTEDDGKWNFDYRIKCLRILATGELFDIRETREHKFYFSMNEPVSGRDSYFRFGEPRPNMIGVATEKKIQSWIDYLHLQNTARANYINANRLRNFNTGKILEDKYPGARIKRDWDGWYLKIIIEDGAIEYTFTALEDGGFSKTVTYIYDKLKSLEDFLKS